VTEVGGLGSSFELVLAAALQGDSDAFDRLYRSYAGRVKAFALVRGTEDADAVANEVLLRVFRSLDSFEGDEAGFTRWVFAIARNHLVDAHRARERRPKLADESVSVLPHPSAEVEALARLGTADALELLNVLTIQQREVVALRMIADLSLEQVASVVGKPVSAVKALQRRGLRRLHKEIASQVVS